MRADTRDWNTAPEFHVATDLAAYPPCVAVWGEVDLASVAAFRDALAEVLATGTRRVTVDLRGVTFMGSTGIRELLRAHRDLDRVEILVPSGIVRRALQSAALPEAFVLVE